MSKANAASKVESENELSSGAIKKSNGDGGTRKPMQVLAPRCSNIQEPKPKDRNKTDVKVIAKDVTQRANETTPPKVKQGGFINILDLPKSRARNFDIKIVESEKKKPPKKAQACDAAGVFEIQKKYISKNLTSEAKIFKIDPTWDSKNVRGQSTETRDVGNTGEPLATPKKNDPKRQPLPLNNQPGTSGSQILKTEHAWDSKNVRGRSTETRDVRHTGEPLATPKKNVPKLHPLALNNQPGTSGSQILKTEHAWDSKNVRGQSTETRDVPLATSKKNVPKLQPLNNQPGTSGSQILKTEHAWDSKNVRGRSTETRDVRYTGEPLATPKKNVPELQPLALNNQPGTSGSQILKTEHAWDSKNVRGQSTETRDVPLATSKKNVPKLQPLNNQPGTSGSQILKTEHAWDSKNVRGRSTETRDVRHTGEPLATPKKNDPKRQPLPLNNQPGTSGSQILRTEHAWDSKNVRGQSTETRDVRHTGGLFATPKKNVPKKQLWPAGDSQNVNGHCPETRKLGNTGGPVDTPNKNVSKPHPMPAWDAKTVLGQNTEKRALGNTGGLSATPNKNVPKPNALPAWDAKTVLGQSTETRASGNTSGVFTIPKAKIPKKQAGTEISKIETAGNPKNGHGQGSETPSVSTQGAAVGNTNAGAQNTKPPIFCKPYSIEEAKQLMLKPHLRSNQPARRTTRTYSVDTYNSFENRSSTSEIPQSSYWNRGLMLENASRPPHGGSSRSQAYNRNQQHRKRPSDNEDVPPEVKRARYEEEQFQLRKANAVKHRKRLNLLLEIINSDPPPPWHSASKMWLEVDELERLIEPFDDELKERAQKAKEAEEAKKAMEAEQAEMVAKAEKTEDANNH